MTPSNRRWFLYGVQLGVLFTGVIVLLCAVIP
jgi:hypothetical protein